MHGDGSFGLNAMELDTAVRHKLPVLVVISLNGGWTADPKREKPGRDLGYTRYDKMAETLGCYGEYVEKAEDIRPALERAQKEVDKGRVAVVNVQAPTIARAPARWRSRSTRPEVMMPELGRGLARAWQGDCMGIASGATLG